MNRRVAKVTGLNVINTRRAATKLKPHITATIIAAAVPELILANVYTS